MIEIDLFDLLYHGSYALFAFAFLYKVFKKHPEDNWVQVTHKGLYHGRGPDLSAALSHWLEQAHERFETPERITMNILWGAHSDRCTQHVTIGHLEHAQDQHWFIHIEATDTTPEYTLRFPTERS